MPRLGVFHGCRRRNLADFRLPKLYHSKTVSLRLGGDVAIGQWSSIYPVVLIYEPDQELPRRILRDSQVGDLSHGGLFTAEVCKKQDVLNHACLREKAETQEPGRSGQPHPADRQGRPAPASPRPCSDHSVTPASLRQVAVLRSSHMSGGSVGFPGMGRRSSSQPAVASSAPMSLQKRLRLGFPPERGSPICRDAASSP
jgi:hypothetical protein